MYLHVYVCRNIVCMYVFKFVCTFVCAMVSLWYVKMTFRGHKLSLRDKIGFLTTQLECWQSQQLLYVHMYASSKSTRTSTKDSDYITDGDMSWRLWLCCLLLHLHCCPSNHHSRHYCCYYWLNVYKKGYAAVCLLTAYSPARLAFALGDLKLWIGQEGERN